MSREYKFRAWDETAKQMILPTDIYGDVRDELLISLAGDVFLCKEESNGNYCPPTLEAKTARNIILMQYTGLKDKNNKDIYEGDIVVCHDHPTGIEDVQGDIYFKDGAYRVTGSIVELGNYGTAWTTVIGNKFQNPELLNTKQ